MTAEAVLSGGLLHDAAALRDYEWYEMPPRIPEETVISTRGACANTQHPGFLNCGPQHAKVQREAKAMCARCPVQDECRTVIDYLRDNVPSPRWVTGMWAGEGPGEQERRRKERAA